MLKKAGTENAKTTYENSRAVLDLHYFPPIPWFAAFLYYDQVWVERWGNYNKQSYRNRCHLLGPAGIEVLTIPVRHTTGKFLYRDARIDYDQKWNRNHWRAIQSAYGKAPFFSHYAGYFQEIFAKKHAFLFDLNLELLEECIQRLHLTKKVLFSEQYHKNYPGSVDDLRSCFHPKKTEYRPVFYQDFPYLQNFGQKFVPGLSILDLIFCKGSETGDVLNKSFKRD